MRKDNTIDKIEPIIRKILCDNEIELVDIIYRREGAGNVLRVLADTKNGITIDECARMNEIIAEALDRENIIEENYFLEISSPGLDRPLKKKADFIREKSKKICVHTYAPIDNKKEFIGILEGLDGEDVLITMEKGGRLSIALDKISSAKLYF